VLHFTHRAPCDRVTRPTPRRSPLSLSLALSRSRSSCSRGLRPRSASDRARILALRAAHVCIYRVGRFGFHATPRSIGFHATRAPRFLPRTKIGERREGREGNATVCRGFFLTRLDRAAHDETSMNSKRRKENENAKRLTAPRYQRICGISEEIGFI